MKPAELRSIRRRLKLTQLQMATTLGVSRSLYGRLESGKAPIRLVVEHAIRWVEQTARRR